MVRLIIKNIPNWYHLALQLTDSGMFLFVHAGLQGVSLKHRVHRHEPSSGRQNRGNRRDIEESIISLLTQN